MSVDIAIDAVGAKHSGAATVLVAVVDAAIRHPRVSRVVIFGSSRTLRQFALPASPIINDVEVSIADCGPAGRIWWHTVGLPRALRARGADALLALSGGGWGPSSCRSTLFIQQSLPFSLEARRRHSWATRARLFAIGEMMKASARRCDRVIVQTPTMKECVRTGLRIAADRIQVVEPDVQRSQADMSAPELSGLREASQQRRAVLYVGNASPYKNLDVLGPAMEETQRLVPGALLFGTFPASHPVLRSRHVRVLPALSRGALFAAYELATVLVMPSLVETVGLPMLEAAAAGTPVVAADRPYAHDVCGDAAVFFDPLSPSDLAVKLESLLTDEALRARLIASGRRNVERRAAGRPYDRMIDIALGEAGGENA